MYGLQPHLVEANAATAAGHVVVVGVTVQRIVAEATGDHVDTGAAIDRVVLVVAEQDIIAGIAVDRIEALAEPSSLFSWDSTCLDCEAGFFFCCFHMFFDHI